jgi:hypothetical protein
VETVVTAQRHNHPGGAYSFRIERNGKVLVVCTDGEQIDPRLVDLARDADLLVHDAQYTAEELQKRRGWGHSSFDQAIQLAEMAGVKRLAPPITTPNTTTSFWTASKNYVENGSRIRHWPAKEWKSRSGREPEVARQNAQHRRGESWVG